MARYLRVSTFTVSLKVEAVPGGLYPMFQPFRWIGQDLIPCRISVSSGFIENARPSPFYIARDSVQGRFVPKFSTTDMIKKTNLCVRLHQAIHPYFNK